MADLDHTLESLSALEISPLIINLIVSEIFVAAPKGIGCIALSVLSHEYEPSILLQGEWVRTMGFKKGQCIQIVAMSDLLAVEPVDETVKLSDQLDFNKVRLALFKTFKDELDAIKANYADSQKGEGREFNEAMYIGSQGREKGNESASSCDNGRKTESKSKRRNGRKSMEKRKGKREDFSEVLAKVSRGDSCD